MTGGAFEYSAKRSSQVLSTPEWTNTSLPEMFPAFAKSAALPLPTSTTGTCFTGASAGAQATDTACARKIVGRRPPTFAFPTSQNALTVISVSPSDQEFGIVKPSV